MITINVVEIIGEFAVDVEDGKKLYEFIRLQLLANQKIELDFTDVLVFNSTFFCYAIAQLFKDFSPADLDLFLKFKMPTREVAKLLQRVVDHGKKYYSKYYSCR